MNPRLYALMASLMLPWDLVSQWHFVLLTSVSQLWGGVQRTLVGVVRTAT